MNKVDEKLAFNIPKKNKIILIVFICFIYSSSILSTVLVSAAHEFFHFFTHSLHLHHHHGEQHENNNSKGRVVEKQNHGHNDFIDYALNAVENKDSETKDQILLIVVLYDHLNTKKVYGKALYDKPILYHSHHLTIHSGYIREPSSPPPKNISVFLA